MKGSSTVSPANENIWIKRSASSTGNGAGCPERVDAPLISVQIERPSPNLNIGVKRHNEMTPSLFTRNAHISNYATDSATVYEHATAFSPNFVEFIQEMLVILDVSHLSCRVVVFLERPIRGGSHD